MTQTRRRFLGAVATTLAWGKTSVLTAPASEARTVTEENFDVPALLKGNAAPNCVPVPSADYSEAERSFIYKQLGFATMSGEDPLKMWARLQNTAHWLSGPLAADGSLGQAFIADHADIFAFRFTAVPEAWLKDFHPGKIGKVRYCGERFDEWCRDTTGWWTRPGPYAPDGSYGATEVQTPDKEPRIQYEWAATPEHEVVCRIAHSFPSDMVIQAYLPWDTVPSRFTVLYSDGIDKHTLRGRSWVPGTRDGLRFVLAFSEPVAETTYHALAPDYWSFPPADRSIAECKWHGLFSNVKTLYLCGRQGQDYEALEGATKAWLEPGKIDSLLARNRNRYLKSRPQGRGTLSDVPAAITDPILSCEVYEPLRRSTYVTVTRNWAGDKNNAIDYFWDTMFGSLLLCQESPQKAHDSIRSVTRWQNDQGMQAQVGWAQTYPAQLSFPVAWGHSGPMVGSLLTAKVYMRAPDRAFLSDIYPRLLKSNRWWFSNRGDGQPWRDGNKNGLLEFGCNYPSEIPALDRRQNAWFESLDDSPQWRDITTYNEQTQTLEQETVLANCLYAMDCRALAWIASELGETNEASRLEREHRAMKTRINALLWEPRRRYYLNRRWAPMNGDWHFPQTASDMFLALTAGVAESEQETALRATFHDPKKFAGEWLVPTISRDDPAFPDQQYWRGKIWPPMNWLLYQGFRAYRWDREAQQLAASSLKMYMKPWRDKGEFHENFLSTSGGDDEKACKHYSWGALMALISIEELTDINPTDGLRFGNLYPQAEGGVTSYEIAGASYDVEISPDHFAVRRNGVAFVEADNPLELRHVALNNGQLSCIARTLRNTKIQIGNDHTKLLPIGTTCLSASYRM